MKRKLIDKKPFEFSARVTLQLGRESISSSTVAISELIKNAYDADAEEVTLNFNLADDNNRSLIITDTGSGMDEDILNDNWLKIGTDNKSIRTLTPLKRRVLTGAKGLGRLGIDRLCKKLVLYTKTSKMDTLLELNVDWSKFENSSLSLSDIENDIFEVSPPYLNPDISHFEEVDSCGTVMVLNGLKDNWSPDFIDKLEKELQLLVSPFKSKNDFKINLCINNNSDNHTSKVLTSEEFLKSARWTVNASINEEGFVIANYHNKQKDIEIKHDAIHWSDWIKSPNPTHLFGPVNFEFYFIPRESSNITKKINLRLKDLREFLDQNQGIRIYRDDFRVRPYGEPSGKGDWLDLGIRRSSSPGGVSQGGWRVGPNQVVAAVNISRQTNGILNDQANREGLVENEAFFQLRAFILKIIETFEYLAHKDAAKESKNDLDVELAEYIVKAKQESKEAAKILMDTVSATYNRKKRKRKKLSDKEKIEKQYEAWQKAIARQEAAAEKYELLLKEKSEKLEFEKNTLSNLASLGILTVSFGHEIRQQSAVASTNAHHLQKNLEDSKNDNTQLDIKDCLSLSTDIKESLAYIKKFSQFALHNIKYDKRTRKKVPVPGVFRYVIEMFEDTFKSMNFAPVVEVHGDEDFFQIYSYEIDWESIAINLITNSIWALDRTPSSDRNIHILFSKVDDTTASLNYSDSGCGLEVGDEEKIFLPMHSSKRDMNGNVIGTGMGLSIVKTQIEDHIGGTIEAIASGKLGGAEFIFSLPVR